MSRFLFMILPKLPLVEVMVVRVFLYHNKLQIRLLFNDVLCSSNSESTHLPFDSGSCILWEDTAITANRSMKKNLSPYIAPIWNLPSHCLYHLLESQYIHFVCHHHITPPTQINHGNWNPLCNENSAPCPWNHIFLQPFCLFEALNNVPQPTNT